MLSIVVPAHNEARLLPTTLQAIHSAAAAAGVPYEVIVVDDASTDDTAAVARRHGAAVLGVERRQIAAVRNAGARAARGDTLLFVDADTTVDAALLRHALAAIDAGAVGGGCGVRFDGRVPLWGRALTALLRRSFRWLRWACGCFVFARRDAFLAVGGFDERLYGGEEVELSRAMKRRGRFVVLADTVVSSGRKLRTHSAWEVLRPFLSIAVRGRSALRSRRGLDLWYGDRREEPQS
jgi:glycosyltransferase involved in cell wall biosynthesis